MWSINTSENAHWGEAIFMWSLWKELCTKKLPINIPENVYWGEYIKVFFLLFYKEIVTLVTCSRKGICWADSLSLPYHYPITRPSLHSLPSFHKIQYGGWCCHMLDVNIGMWRHNCSYPYTYDTLKILFRLWIRLPDSSVNLRKGSTSLLNKFLFYYR